MNTLTLERNCSGGLDGEALDTDIFKVSLCRSLIDGLRGVGGVGGVRNVASSSHEQSEWSGYIKRGVLNVVALFGCLVVVSQAQGASFDCGKAQTKVEHLICDDAEISKLDDELSAAYKVALRDEKQAVSTKQAQKQWMKGRNACADAACVKSACETRLKDLKDQNTKAHQAGTGSGRPARYIIDKVGKGEPFCEAIVAALNKTKPTAEQRPCMSEEVLKMPGVSDPAWEKLDLSQHEELAKKLMTLSTVGSAEYFREKKIMPQIYPTPEQQQRGLDNAKRGGAELFALRLPSEFFGNRILVTLRYKRMGCGLPYQLQGEVSSDAWVAADLKEIATGPGIFDSYAGRPLLYRGQLNLMRPYASGEIEIYVPRHEYISRTCNISLTTSTASKGATK